MRAIFLADAHLHHPDDPNYRALLSFLESLQGAVDTLCILGDLFDFRVGFPALSFPEQEPLLAALKRLSTAGTRLIYLEGNHDFHLDPDLTDRLGAEIHAGPVSLELQGKQLFLCHGDLINKADWRYRFLHLLLRNRVTARIGHLVPAAAVQGARRRLQHSSKKSYSQHRQRWDYVSIIREYATSIRLQGYDALLLGHFHLPLTEQHGQFTLVSLGDWLTQYSYAEMIDGELVLLTYPA
jgi:UDP-2,3-diacylglucosamine hydrolase